MITNESTLELFESEIFILCVRCRRDLPQSAFCEHSAGGEYIEGHGFHFVPEPDFCRECCKICTPQKPEANND